ncbi:ATP-binding protein [Actinoplanes sp. NPDC051859]|uniref:ATP-binding protein n=1 Tax=Actinoplanes sp. NPDC051859 TaxID=3363909 RepID=UPI00379F31FA
MKDRPPYLFATAVRRPASAHVAVTSDVGTAVTELAVHGRWERRMAAELSTAIRKCHAEQPRAVIVNLHDLGDPLGDSMPLWLTERRVAMRLRPAVLLALSLPTTAPLHRRLRRVGAYRYLPMYASMPEAHAALADQSPRLDLMQVSLPPELTAARTARDLVEQACVSWGLTRVLHPARLVVSELTANAVTHARTDLTVTVSRRGSGLHVSVSDGDPQLPQLDPPESTRAEHGRGLYLVHKCAAAWGSMPTCTGKVVWATLYHRSRL